MNKQKTLESLKYFETVSRWQKGLFCIVVFFVFWLINQMIFNLNFTCIEQLLIWMLFPIAIFCVFFLGYRQSVKIEQGDNSMNIGCNLPTLIISLNRCGFDLQAKVGDYYLMQNRFLMQYHKKLTVTDVGDECVVFGNVNLLKMLNADLVTLKTVYTTKET